MNKISLISRNFFYVILTKIQLLIFCSSPRAFKILYDSSNNGNLPRDSVQTNVYKHIPLYACANMISRISFRKARPLNSVRQIHTSIILLAKKSRDSALTIEGVKKLVLSDDKNSNNLDTNSVTYAVLKDICQNHGISKVNASNASRNVKLLLLQKRLSDQDILKCLEKYNKPDVISNIKLPSKESTTTVTKPKVEIHPYKSKIPPSLVNKVKTKDKSEKIDIIKKLQEEVGKSEDIDLQSLRQYLNLVEKREEQLKQMQKIEKRMYKWKDVDKQVDLTAGKLLFSKQDKAPKKTNIKVRRYMTKINGILDIILRSNKKYRPILIIDLENKEQEHKFLGKNFNLFDVNHTDIYGIINSSPISPEEVLGVITKAENSGFKLIGNIYNQEKKIVFQGAKNVETSSSISPLKLAIISLILGTPLAYFYMNNIQEDKAETNKRD